jgi:hypothetical protein
MAVLNSTTDSLFVIHSGSQSSLSVILVRERHLEKSKPAFVSIRLNKSEMHCFMPHISVIRQFLNDSMMWMQRKCSLQSKRQNPQDQEYNAQIKVSQDCHMPQWCELWTAGRWSFTFDSGISEICETVPLDLGFITLHQIGLPCAILSSIFEVTS